MNISKKKKYERWCGNDVKDKRKLQDESNRRYALIKKEYITVQRGERTQYKSSSDRENTYGFCIFMSYWTKVTAAVFFPLW